MERAHGARHHTIVVVDVEGFGDRRRTNPHQRGVRDGLYHVVQTAFDAAGVPWTDCYHEDRGDAVFILAPAATSKAVFVETLPYMLVTALRVHNDTHPDAQRIRLRMALHAGEVHYDDHGVTSSSLILAFRLIDAQPLKAVLTASPGVLAMITSNWFFDEVVRHTPGAAPATYRPVRVSEKETPTIGWITLPDHPYPPNTARFLALPATGDVDSRRRLVPRQLPLAVRDFTGRAEHLATLDALIPPEPGSDEPEGNRAQAVIVTAIDGTAGIGKTTLVVQWAHRAQHRFPDGTLHTNLRGYGPGNPVAPGEVLDGFLCALDIPVEKVPVGLDAKAALYRSLVDGRRMLIVLDNAHSADQIRPLLPGAPGCMVVVTSRDSLTGLVVTEAAYRLAIDLFTLSEALHLVTGIIGTDRAAAGPDAVNDLIQLCARLPLALRIAANRVAAHPKTTVAEVAHELSDERNRLNVLSRSGDDRAAVRTVFNWSYLRLPADQARLFRCLGLHPGPDLSLPAAAAVAGLDPETARALINDLASAHLIEPTGTARYRFHDLLRAYAADQARCHDRVEDREHAMQALLNWYGHTASTCADALFPGYPRPSLQAITPVHPTQIRDRAPALHWLDNERENLFAVIQYAIRRKLHQHTVQLAHGLRLVSSRGGTLNDTLDVLGWGLDAARNYGDVIAQVSFLSHRSEIFRLMRRWDDAQADLEQALGIARTHGDRNSEGGVLIGLGWLSVKRGLLADALAHLGQAKPLVKGILRQEVLLEGSFCRVYTESGRYRQALEHGERCRTLSQRAHDADLELSALDALAHAWQGLGEHQRAIDLCREAIIRGRAASLFPRELADPLDTLAISLHHSGDTAEAITCWRESVRLLEGSFAQPLRAEQVRQPLHAAQTSAEEGAVRT